MILENLKDTVFENIPNSQGLFEKHYHDTYTIGITHDGFFKSFHLNTSKVSYKYSTRIINPYDMHYGDSRSWNYTNFYPSIKLLEEIYFEIFLEKKVPIFNEHIIEDKKLYLLLWQMFDNIYKNSEEMLIHTSVIEALSYLVLNFTSSSKRFIEYPSSKEKMNLAVEYINDMLDSQLSLEDISNSIGMSKYHFLRVFKNTFSMTPYHYIQMSRVNNAKNLVLKGESMSYASITSGFCDQSHFIKNFRKIYGYSPKNLLDKNRLKVYI